MLKINSASLYLIPMHLLLVYALQRTIGFNIFAFNRIRFNIFSFRALKYANKDVFQALPCMQSMLYSHLADIDKT